MAQNEKISKLKSKRFNKFEISESTNQTNKFEKSSDEPYKRLTEKTETTSRKQISYNFMHPPSSTVNLANNRLQKLKQTIQNDLKNRKPLSTVTMKDSLLKQNLQGCDPSISKNSSKLINPINSARIDSVQQKLNINNRISRSPSNVDSDRSSISSSHDVAVPNSSVLLKNNSTSETSKPIKENYRSPLIEEKINRKRKFSEPPLTSDEYIPTKKISVDPNLSTHNVSQVKTPSNSYKSKLSSRLLKIKTKTDKINSSLTSPFNQTCSKSNDQLEEHKSSPCTPHSLHKLPDRYTPNQDSLFQTLDNSKNNQDNNISKNCISPKLKVNNRVELSETDNFIKQTKPQTLLQKDLTKSKLLENVPSPNSTDFNRPLTSSTLTFSKKTTNNNNINSSSHFSVSKTLSEELISAHNTPLLDSNDPTDKLAMTASWIQNHQQYSPAYKITDEAHERLFSVTNVNESKDEEMEWTNAEPDIYQDYTTIGGNPLIEDQSKTVDSIRHNQKQQRLCIVVDTNVFISDLSKINDIINLKVTGPLQPLVYIPWMVITELDELKDRSNNSLLKNKVYNAIKCINKLLSEENPRVKGQTISDMGNQVHVGSAQDDKIIGTCLQATEKYEIVMLLSNDVNLKNKALINNISVSSAHEIIMKIMSKLVKTTKYQKIKQKMGMICSNIICESAKEAYGDVWMRMNMMANPPWSLGECLKRFQKYWSSVYQQKLMKQFLSTVNKLQKLLDDNSAFIADDSDKYQEFVKLCLNICIFLKDIEEFKGSIENTINDIVKIG